MAVRKKGHTDSGNVHMTLQLTHLQSGSAGQTIVYDVCVEDEDGPFAMSHKSIENAPKTRLNGVLSFCVKILWSVCIGAGECDFV